MTFWRVTAQFQGDHSTVAKTSELATQEVKDCSLGQLYCCYEIEYIHKNKENNKGQVFSGH